MLLIVVINPFLKTCAFFGKVLQKRYRKMEDSRQETNESSSTESDTHQESGENMDFEDSQDSLWTTQSTSNTTFDSHKHNPDLESVDSDEAVTVENSVNIEEDLLSGIGKQKPKHKWNALIALTQRNLGTSSHKNMDNAFNAKCHGSLRFVQRLELAFKMDCHNGCVNALHFNSSGSRLASGSDDLSIIIWDWSRAEPVVNYDSGHRGNVFQAKFLPLCGDTHIVSCARDGHIRLAELSPSGVFHSTRRLGLHRGPAHKLALLPDTPHVFLTAGEDGVVFEVDVRQSKPNKLLTVKHCERKIALYSISTHPIDTTEFCVGGRDQFVRIYDRRHISSNSESATVRKSCPRHLVDSSVRAHVTSAVYNFNGSELLASYNDEDIYSFASDCVEGSDFLHRYSGHRNNATVKGVNYYGPRSEFVVSGSDCGNIFFWDNSTEAIVQCIPGDENGVVNCLEPHPSIPVLATSGLDDDVKIWTPKCFDEPQLWDLKKTVKTNHQEREEERRREPDTISGELLWVLWRHVRRTERRRRQQQQRTSSQERNDGNVTSSSDESDVSENDEGPRGVQCAPS
ncbi:DDB1- and CUL4-associated factor 8-like isoform X2 [Daphnia pulicaria]|uniref:DDB1- and CUL4-associated factor 8-like isoform X2 n=1 Tax=Daphnia pulicaria TaxID=35523 RepID=UPI001EEA9D9D|nr:DDB1- and CUL4-associated factor 8-like isoform X2 [Daphnia pulicaria]